MKEGEGKGKVLIYNLYLLPRELCGVKFVDWIWTSEFLSTSTRLQHASDNTSPGGGSRTSFASCRVDRVGLELWLEWIGKTLGQVDCTVLLQYSHSTATVTRLQVEIQASTYPLLTNQIARFRFQSLSCILRRVDVTNRNFDQRITVDFSNSQPYTRRAWWALTEGVQSLSHLKLTPTWGWLTDFSSENRSALSHSQQS